MGLDRQAFEGAFRAADTEGHISNSRAFLAKVGGQGFPTLVLEDNDQFTLIDIGPWLGKPQAFAQWLSQSLPDQGASTPVAVCGLEGCID